MWLGDSELYPGYFDYYIRRFWILFKSSTLAGGYPVYQVGPGLLLRVVDPMIMQFSEPMQCYSSPLHSWSMLLRYHSENLGVFPHYSSVLESFGVVISLSFTCGVHKGLPRAPYTSLKNPLLLFLPPESPLNSPGEKGRGSICHHWEKNVKARPPTQSQLTQGRERWGTSMVFGWCQNICQKCFCHPGFPFLCLLAEKLAFLWEFGVMYLFGVPN